jgi:conjugative relaxase-like TrwC/TraI family protein
MFRITKSMSADAAEKYVREALAKSDYYQNAKQLGVAYGKCGERMGIIGDVEHEVFVSLLNNKVPGSEQSWTPRTNGQRRELVWKHDEEHDRWHQEIEAVANRRCGWDLTNNARKSVSIHYAATGDELMLRLFHESNQEAMQFGETFMQTRHKVKGPDGKAIEVNQVTGNALWVTYIHGETRPIEGKCDMHLHAHNYLLNGTWDESKGRYAAVQPGELYRNAPVIQAHAEQVFVQKLLEHGYQIRETVGKGNKLGWELAHVSDQMIREFSRRTEEIEREARINHAKVMARAEALAERDSIDLADALAVIKAKLGSETRKRKAEATLSPDEQREEWRERVGTERWDAIMVQAAQQSPPFVARSVEEARQKAAT